ncbi:uncharacterized protein LOC133798443 isoform X2 [Humulus lupulus]|uniref:uncharacterized protein LOC133798443 isoform X2 n=1 Tax=Humulus lupulus TaxID=3486 RepID=UPI002B404634|nr:uncharacterized protein LOC133798443 isoform X2 [Humulus lupulus]
MESDDHELRIPNPELHDKPSPKVREEGELSSDDEDVPSLPQEDHVCSAQQCTSIDAPAGLGPVPPENKCSDDFHEDNAVFSNNPAVTADIHSRASIKPMTKKNFDKSRVPSNTRSPGPGWCTSVGATDNLVIRFSDNDSGSDSDECVKEKAAENKSSIARVVRNQKPPAPLHSKLNKQVATGTVSKVIPKRLPLSRTFISSVAKIPGPNFSGAGQLPVEHGNRIRKVNSLKKNVSSQERGYDQGVGLSNSKLQDLRQQIALRESELKLKSAQRSKEAGSLRDDNAMSLPSDAARKIGATSAKSAQRESKEPEKKRTKVTGSYSNQLNSMGLREVSVGRSILPLKQQPMQNNMAETIKLDHGQKENTAGRTEPSITKWHQKNWKQGADLPENISAVPKDGFTVVRNCIESGGNSKHVESSSMLTPNASPAANKISNVVPMNLNNVELNPSKIVPRQQPNTFFNNVELNPSKIVPRQQPNTFFNKAMVGKNLLLDNHPHISSNDKIPEPAVNDKSQASLNNENFWNCSSNANVSERNGINVQSLVEMEDSLDKDLEEAQELRHRCEIEERNALKAYRKAQRNLIEANARCSDLYRKRELYSTHLRSFIMDNSDLLCSSRQNEKDGIGSDYSNNVSENMLLLPPSNHLVKYNGFNPLGVGSNFHYINILPVQTSDRHANGQNLGSEPGSELDASTSEPLCCRDKAAADGVRSSSNDPNIDEDDESFSFERETVKPGFGCLTNDNSFVDMEKDVIMEPGRKGSIDSSRESFLLEETLRSELFARLGAKNLSKTGGSCNNIPLTTEQGTENDVSSEKTQTSLQNFPSSEVEEGPGRLERSNSDAPDIQLEHCNEDNCLISHSLTNSEDNRVYDKEDSSCISISSSNIFKSAFANLKTITPQTLMEWLARNQQNYTSGINKKEDACAKSDQMQGSNTQADSTDEAIVEFFGREIGSYNCDIAVDPFRPLCMYELRGKCNNDECPWQHVRDNSSAIISHDQNNDSDSDAKVPKYYDVMISPTYLVGLDTLKADLHSYESVLAWRNSHCWQKCFSISLTLSSLLSNGLPAHGPLAQGSDGRIEVCGSWSRQSSYILSRTGRVNELKQSLADNEQALETAILIFNQEVDRFEAMKEALHIISRALEANPRSISLWIFYLLLYYGSMKSTGKDDLFSYAVKYNQGSYELWLMYINSRTHIDDRLMTYNSALSALCHCNTASDWDGLHASACILDLFLQMVDCLCMSGNVEKAIQKIFDLLTVGNNSDEPPVLLSDILSCLTVSDKCIFWISCVYLVIYRKLPDAVVQQFECEKQPSEIEWPSILLLHDEKQRAVKLIEKGMFSIDSLMETELLKNDINLRSAHFFAVNHIRCMVALDNLECCRNLLDRYLGLYPSCLELVLIRAREKDFGGLSFSGFEETLGSWPKEVPGIQCIWNQYAQCAVKNGGYEFGKALMDRWFHSVWEVHDKQNGMNSENIELASVSISETLPTLSPIDVMFGFLNLSLYKLMQNDRLGACIAVEKALKASIPKYFKYCIGEHAMFLLTDELQLKENVSVSGVLNILERYIGNSLPFSVPEPLPRKFINSIKKPRVRQLISNIFCPVSSDFSLVNLVLEVWYGPSFLLELLCKPKLLVDFVEGILDISPSNYELAMSVCRHLSSRNNSTDLTLTSMLFWASSNLVSAIFLAVPIPPELVWVEAASILGNVMGVDIISKRFYRRALLVYPFSVKLWKSYQTLYTDTEMKKSIAEEAKAKGLHLG